MGSEHPAIFIAYTNAITTLTILSAVYGAILYCRSHLALMLKFIAVCVG